jgi:hypothetical protein
MCIHKKEKPNRPERNKKKGWTKANDRQEIRRTKESCLISTRKSTSSRLFKDFEKMDGPKLKTSRN